MIAGATQRRTIAGRPRRPSSLRASVSLVIAALSLFPNVAIVVVVLLPTVRDQPELASSLVPAVVAWVVAVAALSAFVGYSLSRALLRPLTTLRDEVSDLQASGRRLVTLGLEDADGQPAEVVAVRRALGALIDGLKAEQEKRAAFMATLVHDLKTPILASNHVLRVVRDEASLARAERVRLVASVLDENRRLLDLVQKMVDAYRFEREGIALDLVPVELGHLARTVAERFRATAVARGVSLVVEGDGVGMAAPGELERALANLVDNAIRYAGSRVQITVSGPAFRVSDDGPGLLAPFDRLTEPFGGQRIVLAGRQYTTGAGGLGLFIAKQIALAHGGNLFDEPVERGACLCLVLQTP